MQRRVHVPLGSVQPFTVPQIIASIPLDDDETRAAIVAMDVERMRARVAVLEPALMAVGPSSFPQAWRRGAMACYALLVTLAVAAGDARAVSQYCAWAALDLDGAA